MYKFNSGQILRTEWHWKSTPYVLSCPIPECEVTFRDKAHEWAHSWFHIKDNKRQLNQLASR